MTEHGLTENHAVTELLGSDRAARRTLAVITRVFTCFRISTEVGMTLWSEPVERAAHIQFLLRRHIK